MSIGYSPFFLLYGREPSFPSRIQDLATKAIDPQNGGAQSLKLQLHLAHWGSILQGVTPLAMRNPAIAQQRDQERFRHIRGGGYDGPKATFSIGDSCWSSNPKETHKIL